MTWVRISGGEWETSVAGCGVCCRPHTHLGHTPHKPCFTPWVFLAHWNMSMNTYNASLLYGWRTENRAGPHTRQTEATALGSRILWGSASAHCYCCWRRKESFWWDFVRRHFCATSKNKTSVGWVAASDFASGGKTEQATPDREWSVSLGRSQPTEQCYNFFFFLPF